MRGATETTADEPGPDAGSARLDPSLRDLQAGVPRGHRGVLALGTLTAVAATVVAFVLIARMVADVLLGGRLPAPGPVLVAAVALIVRAAALAGRESLANRFARHQVARHRRDLTAAALRLGPVLLAEQRSTELTVLDNELVRLQPFYGRYLPTMIQVAVTVPALLAATFWLDPATGVLLAITGPLCVLFLILVGLATARATEEQWHQHTRLGSRLVDVMRRMPVLQSFGAVGVYREVFAESARRHSRSTYKVLRMAFLNGFVMEFAATISTALVAVWIGVRLFGGEAQLAPTLAALMLVAEYFAPLRQLGADRHAAMDAGPVAKRLAELLARRPAPSGERRGAGVPELVFEAAYAQLPARLTPVTATLPAGAHAVLQGPSGTGKSSLLYALRKHVPHEGRILVDATELDELDTAAWQARTALVPQHPRLVAGTVWENLRLVRPDASDERVREAARRVGLDPVLRALPQGYSTRLGEGGVQLSGGETARLGLARVLLAEVDVVLLDEVTSHLDTESEDAVLTVIESALAGRSVLLASHRAAPPGWLRIEPDPTAAAEARTETAR